MAIFRNLHAGRKQTVVVYGTSLSHTAGWTKALGPYFETHFPGQVTVINAAMSGRHSSWGLEHLSELVLVHHPDLVLIEFSINDAATKHGISVMQSRANLDAMVNALRRQNPEVEIVLQIMNPVWDVPNDPDGKRAASDRPHYADYNEIYRKYARERGLPLLDHYPKWLTLQRDDPATFKQWLPDGTHPIPEASLAVTWALIEAWLEQCHLSIRKRDVGHE